jgi:effector-binding domain-containing protein
MVELSAPRATGVNVASHRDMNVDVPVAAPLDSNHYVVSEKRARRALATSARRTRLASGATLALPAVGLVAGGWLVSKGARAIGLSVIGASIGLAFTRWQLARVVTESASYAVKERIGPIEIRRYPAHMIAETSLLTEETPSWEESLEEGFRRLAGYINGKNESGSRIAMTAPVYMTKPETDWRRTMSFVMPADIPGDDLPRPRDGRIRLREVPAQDVAVLGFRGNYKSALPAKKARELLEYLREAGMRTVGDVSFAGYDAPWTMSGLRRNEVSIAVEHH